MTAIAVLNNGGTSSDMLISRAVPISSTPPSTVWLHSRFWRQISAGSSDTLRPYARRPLVEGGGRRRNLV